MAYQIFYEKSAEKIQISEPIVVRHRFRKILLLTAFVIVVSVFWGIRGTLREYLLPGDWEQTEAAFSSFLGDIRSGNTFKDAALAFCREVVDNAGISR